MSSNFNNLVNQLKKGELPIELTYSNQEKQEIDWAKVKYNSFYKTPDFFASKFPAEWTNNFPAFSKICENMAANAKTPLEEMEERQAIISENIVNDQ
jgi:hypothetical protein